jgi:glycosyltransferase involved in cell wall biosynthesis
MNTLWVKNNSEIKLSIITEVLYFGSFKYKIFYTIESFKFFLKSILKIKKNKYTGHSAVTRSLIEGLFKIGYSHNYNPKIISQLANNVVVLSNVNAVNQMINLKKKGYISKLFIGPNVISSPITFKNILSPYIDGILVPSDPVKILTVSTYPCLFNKCHIWPAGVDNNIWSKIETVNRQSVLLFIKEINYKPNLVSECKNLLDKYKLDYQVLNYGRFTQKDLYEKLEKSFLMICFSRIESQGILYAESWCADVPTFIYYNFEPTFYGIKYNGNSAPYLNDFNGKFFNNTAELEKLIIDIHNGKVIFAPRDWCSNNMTDEICAQKFIDIINKVNEN